ncbi:unnamed protein product [Callosobruchus maculatus]|uniref:Uncharacterized protein n=1 Tax=Callosobruchus maculatus TaxID=64391 RepID=A0A653C756_CALMS|nr:unnamed protein product [Callosobruchus maculatus]
MLGPIPCPTLAGGLPICFSTGGTAKAGQSISVPDVRFWGTLLCVHVCQPDTVPHHVQEVQEGF